MARIREFSQLPSRAGVLHGEVGCGFKILSSTGRLTFSLAHGSGDRERMGKISQSIQLDVTAVGDPMSILRRAFPQIQ